MQGRRGVEGSGYQPPFLIKRALSSLFGWLATLIDFFNVRMYPYLRCIMVARYSFLKIDLATVDWNECARDFANALATHGTRDLQAVLGCKASINH